MELKDDLRLEESQHYFNFVMIEHDCTQEESKLHPPPPCSVCKISLPSEYLHAWLTDLMSEN